MRKRTYALVAVWGVLVLAIAWFIGQKPGGVSYAELLSLQPKSDGHTITYWMEQNDVRNGRRNNVDWDAAIRSIGVESVPYLVKWIGAPSGYYPHINYPERALRGFEILGPTANPAIPDLIKMVGQNQDFPERALFAIGKDSVRPLADKLVESLSDTNSPFVQGSLRAEVRKTSGFHIGGCALRVLGRMGTNAESATPAVIACLNTATSGNQAAAAATLAIIGRNQPDLVIPALLNAFSNSILAAQRPAAGLLAGRLRPTRGPIATALGTIGKSRPETVIPVLIAFLTHSDPQTADRGAVAGALAQVGNDRPEVIIPVLIYALTNGDRTAADRNGIASSLAAIGFDHSATVIPALVYAFTNSSIQAQPGIADALGTLGRDSKPAVPYLLQAGNSTDWNLRARAAIAVKMIAPETPSALKPLIKNLEGADNYARYRALYELGRLGTNGTEALPALAQLLSHPNWQVRTDTERCIQDMKQFSDGVLIALGENLSHTNPFTAGAAWETLADFAPRSRFAFRTMVRMGISGSATHDVQEQCKRSLVNLSRENPTVLLENLEDSDARVRYGALRVFRELDRRIPASISRLRQLTTSDPDENVRKLAVNVLKTQE